MYYKNDGSGDNDGNGACINGHKYVVYGGTENNYYKNSSLQSDITLMGSNTFFVENKALVGWALISDSNSVDYNCGSSLRLTQTEITNILEKQVLTLP